jgi:hypothetical protein
MRLTIKNRNINAYVIPFAFSILWILSFAWAVWPK